MKIKSKFAGFIVDFFIITACITILEGVLGSLFMPDMRFGPSAFFAPPIFGFLTALTGFIVESKKELTEKQMLFRMILQLIVIECIVFGVNFAVGNRYTAVQWIILAIAIAVVFVLVYFIIWLSEYRSAAKFNRMLKEYQRENK